MAEAARTLSALASCAAALAGMETSSLERPDSLRASAAHMVLQHASKFLEEVTTQPSFSFDASDVVLRQCTSLPATIFDAAERMALGCRPASLALGTAACLASAAQLTAVSLRLAVNPSKLASPLPESDPSSALSVDGSKELAGAAGRAMAGTSARAVYACRATNTGLQAHAAMLLPLLSAYERCLSVHPTVFRRVIPDALTLAVATCGLAAGGSGGEGESEAVLLASAGRLAALAIVVAYRFSGKQGGGNNVVGGGSAPPTLSSAVRTLLEVLLPQHTATLQATAAYAPAALPSIADFASALAGTVPADGVAFSRPSEALTAAVAGLASPATLASAAGSSGEAAVVKARYATGRITFCIEVVRSLVLRPAPTFSLVSCLSLSPPPSPLVEVAVLPLPLIMSVVDSLGDAAHTVMGAAVAVHRGASAAACNDPVLGPALVASSLTLSAAALRLTAALSLAAPGHMRRYRTAVSRGTLRAMQQVITVAAYDARAGTSGARLASTLLGHAPPLGLPFTLHDVRAHAILPLALAAWHAYTTCVGLGVVGTGPPTPSTSGWGSEPSPSPCPEGLTVLRLTCAVALAVTSHVTGVLLVDPAWTPLMGALTRACEPAWGGESSPCAGMVSVLSSLVSTSPSSLPDAIRVRIEQAALVLASAWPGHVVHVDGRGGREVPSGGKGSVYSARLTSEGGVAGGDALPPQAKRHKGHAADPTLLFSALPVAGSVHTPALSRGVECASRSVGSVGGQSGGGDEVHGGGTGGRAQHTRLHLSPDLAGAVASLLTTCALQPWSSGVSSPFTPYLRAALSALVRAPGRGAALAGMDAATAAAVEAVLADRAVVATVPMPLSAFLELQHGDSGTSHAPPALPSLSSHGTDVHMDEGGGEKAERGLTTVHGGSASTGQSFGAAPVSVVVGASDASLARFPTRTSSSYSASTSVMSHAPGGAPAPRLTEAEAARLATYADALGDDFPDL